jgi:hypothetical protein
MGKSIGTPRSRFGLLVATSMFVTSSLPAQPAATSDRTEPLLETGDTGEAASVTPPSPRETSEPASDETDPEVEATFSAEELTPQDYRDVAPPGSKAPPPNRARKVVGPSGPEPEDIYLLVPRTVLLLPRLTLDAVFFPVRGLAVLVDEYHLVEHVQDVLYNDARTAAIVPTLGYQNEYGFTAGLKAFHDDVLGNGEEASISAQYGGLYQQAYKLKFEGDEVAHSPLWLQAALRYEFKPGVLFWGIGNRSLSEAGPEPVDPRAAAIETRYRENRSMASLLVGETIRQDDQSVQLGMMGIYNRRRFGPSTRNFNEPSLEEAYDTSQLVGYDEGVDVLELGPVVIFDSRDQRVLSSRGNYLNSFASYGIPFGQDQGFWHYGVTAATFINLYKRSRVLSLRTVLEAVHGDDAELPFTDLMRLGGADRLRGYGSDRFRENLSFVATAEYRYPIHDLVAGEAFVDAGRVGPRYRDVFALSNENPLRVGAGLGLVVHNQEDVLFKAEAAYGDDLTLFFATSPLEVFSERHKRL